MKNVRGFGPKDAEATFAALGRAEDYVWTAKDGWEIHGWLLRPVGEGGPRAVIVDVHGGPVWSWRPGCVGRSALYVTLLRAGYAIFQPNPRGSTGRGQDFARAVAGDMGGADAQDILSGLDRLVADGIVDPKRIGVTGISYGGIMSGLDHHPGYALCRFGRRLAGHRLCQRAADQPHPRLLRKFPAG